jgi:hypothetical protein
MPTVRGNRGGKDKKQKQLQGAVADQQMPPQPPQPGPSQPGPSFPPPTPGYQWVQAPTPQPHPDYQGYFAAHINAGRPLPKIPPIPYQSRYKSFNNAKRLADRLGVRPTSETLKTLEGPYLQQEETRDPRPAKRSRTDSPRGEAQGRCQDCKACLLVKVSRETSD